jgi:hypothetical protein
MKTGCSVAGSTSARAARFSEAKVIGLNHLPDVVSGLPSKRKYEMSLGKSLPGLVLI